MPVRYSLIRQGLFNGVGEGCWHSATATVAVSERHVGEGAPVQPPSRWPVTCPGGPLGLLITESEVGVLTGLKDDPFFGAAVLGVLEEGDRRYLAERSCRRRIDKGQILFSEGDHSDSVLVLISGHMKVLTYSRDGGEFIVNTVVPGETIGEIGVLSSGPRSATVQATEASVVLSLAGSVLVDLISQRPALAIALLERLSDMVRRITGVATDLVFLDLKQRVAKYLLQGASGGPPPVRSGVTQSELAANIGASRQRVNTCLRDFQRQGWISMESKRLRVLDAEALSRFVTL